MVRASRERITLRSSLDVFAKANAMIGKLLIPIYNYNSLIKPKGYYLKPVHIVTRYLPDGTKITYYYYGRYWYRLEKDPATKKLKWKYLGKEKPDPSLPDPPPFQLEGLVIKKYESYVEFLAFNESFLKLFSEFLSGISKGAP